MKANAKKQYTIRNVPKSLDKALKIKASQENKSLNTVLLEAIAKEVGQGLEQKVYSDLDFLIGSWVSDPDLEQSLKEQRVIQPKEWL